MFLLNLARYLFLSLSPHPLLFILLMLFPLLLLPFLYNSHLRHNLISILFPRLPEPILLLLLLPDLLLRLLPLIQCLLLLGNPLLLGPLHSCLPLSILPRLVLNQRIPLGLLPLPLLYQLPLRIPRSLLPLLAFSLQPLNLCLLLLLALCGSLLSLPNFLELSVVFALDTTRCLTLTACSSTLEMIVLRWSVFDLALVAVSLPVLWLCSHCTLSCTLCGRCSCSVADATDAHSGSHAWRYSVLLLVLVSCRIFLVMLVEVGRSILLTFLL